DLELEGTHLERVPVAQLALALDRVVVDEGAVGALKVADERRAAAHQDGTMAFADGRTGRPEMALRVPTDDELRKGDRDRLPFRLPRRQHQQTQFHETTSPGGCRGT